VFVGARARAARRDRPSSRLQERLDTVRLLLFLFRLMSQKNVDKLVSAGLVVEDELTANQKHLINDLSDEEISAIISAGTKVVSGTKSGEKVAKISV
jgi:hypothetical protein